MKLTFSRLFLASLSYGWPVSTRVTLAGEKKLQCIRYSSRFASFYLPNENALPLFF